MSDGTTQSRSRHDADEWIEALAGRTSADPNDAMTQALRAALLARESDLRGSGAGLHSLLARLEGERLLPPPGREVRALAPLPLAAAASLAGVALLAGLLVTRGPSPEDVASSDAVRFRGFGTEVAVSIDEPERWIRQTELALDRSGCTHARPGEPPLTLVVDATEHCLDVVNEQLPSDVAALAEPGRYRLLFRSREDR